MRTYPHVTVRLGLGRVHLLFGAGGYWRLVCGKRVPEPYHFTKLAVTCKRCLSVLAAQEKRREKTVKRETTTPKIKKYRRMEALLPRIRDLIKRDLEEIGGCDHSVGICMCDEYRLLDEVLDLIGEPVPERRYCDSKETEAT